MYKISSGLTDFLVKVLPWVLSICIIIFSSLYIISNRRLTFLIAFVFIFFMYLILWWFFFKKLQTVYLGEKKLKINNIILPFKNIISINTFFLSPAYQIKYLSGGEIKSFIFFPKFKILFFTPSYIKEIKEEIKLRGMKDF